MDFLPINELSFWTILIPGFITVWTFRYFTDSQKKGDFEFLGLGIFCGLINLIVFGLLINWGLFKLPPSTDPYPYAIAFILSLFSFLLGLASAQVTTWNWFQRLMSTLKKNWFRLKG